jgi:DNA-binding response OmpR family regulator
MRALILTDQVEAAEFLAAVLRQGGATPALARDPLAAIASWHEESADVVLLDVNRLDFDAIALARRFREYSTTPVIVLTPHTDEAHALALYDSGADDVVVKPYSPRLLLARLRALLRRSGAVPMAALSTLSAGPITLDPEFRTASAPDRPAVRLTNLEFRLLYALMVNRGQVLRTETLVEKVWGYSGESERGLLKGLISRLRSKIEPDSKTPCYVLTVPGVGYTYSPPEAQPTPGQISS